MSINPAPVLSIMFAPFSLYGESYGWYVVDVRYLRFFDGPFVTKGEAEDALLKYQTEPEAA